MQTMDQALAELYKASVITYETALRRSQNPAEFERLCQGES
jgi:Tfp pilus assembly ATPase PilU